MGKSSYEKIKSSWLHSYMYSWNLFDEKEILFMKRDNPSTHGEEILFIWEDFSSYEKISRRIVNKANNTDRINLVVEFFKISQIWIWN